MLLYKMTKLVEDHSRRKQGFTDPLAELADLTIATERMELSSLGMIDEDCSDWGAEATY
jgi:hypothetical protein